MQDITIKTSESKEVVDITNEIEGRVSITEGTVTLSVLHTTAAVTTADLDPGTDQDMLEAYWKMIPQINFRHAHDPAHTPAHLLAALIGPSVTLVVSGGKIMLGSWQRIVLVEFGGPRERKLKLVEIPIS